MIIAVGHEMFKNLGIKFIRRLRKNHIIFDLKSLFSKEEDIIRL